MFVEWIYATESTKIMRTDLTIREIFHDLHAQFQYVASGANWKRLDNQKEKVACKVIY